MSRVGNSAARVRMTATWARKSDSQALTAFDRVFARSCVCMLCASLVMDLNAFASSHHPATGTSVSARLRPPREGRYDTGVKQIEGRPQRLAADPLPCTKSVLQSHSALAATANN